MIRHLSTRERVLVVGGGLVAATVLVWDLGVQPMRERDRQAEELRPVREQLLARREELIGRRARITADLDAVNAELRGLGDRFFTAATPAVVAAELQKTVKDLATAAQTEVRSERILPPVDRGDLLEIPIEIAVSGEIRQLVDFLARLGQAPKLVTVQELKIRVVNVTQPKELLSTLTLSGFILAGAPAG